MEYEGQLTIEDALQGHRIYSRKKLVWWIYILRWFAIGVVVGLTLVFSKVRMQPLLIVGYIIFVVGIIARHFIVSSETKKRISKQDMLFLPFHSRIDDSGFETHYGKDTNYRNWNEFTGWYEADKYFVLTENVGYRIIPKRVLKNIDQLSELRLVLQKHLGNAG
jgi:hypothetical protein